MLQLIYIFGHVLIVNSRCYGRCYVKNLIPLSTFLKFHTHLEENSVTSFQNVFDKSSRVLILAFPRNWIFHGHRHILGYHTPLSVYRGDVYKKVLVSQFTFKFLFPMKNFLLNLMGIETLKIGLSNISSVCYHCWVSQKAITQLKIDRNLVEVQDGW